MGWDGVNVDALYQHAWGPGMEPLHKTVADRSYSQLELCNCVHNDVPLTSTIHWAAALNSYISSQRLTMGEICKSYCRSKEKGSKSNSSEYMKQTLDMCWSLLLAPHVTQGLKR